MYRFLRGLATKAPSKPVAAKANSKSTPSKPRGLKTKKIPREDNPWAPSWLQNNPILEPLPDTLKNRSDPDHGAKSGAKSGAKPGAGTGATTGAKPGAKPGATAGARPVKIEVLDKIRSIHSRQGRRRPHRPRRHEISQFDESNVASKIDSTALEMNAVQVDGQPVVPGLANDLSRALFNPGVHFIKDPRTNVYNFKPALEDIMSIKDFDFSCIAPYVPSGKDGALSQLAAQHGKLFTGSTSSLTGALTQLHHAISHERPPQIMGLSKYFRGETTTFSAAQRAPTSMFLRYNPKTKTYSVNSDGSSDDDMLLTLLGQTMETMLVTDSDLFQKYHKDRSHELDESLKDPKSTYNYSECGDFMMRSQLDCYDSRLPGTGMFDLKTRAVCAVRYDIDYAQIHDGSSYQIVKRDGEYESYSREFFELVRSAMFKYSLQARIGRMDGIFVAYHNVRRMFGVEYLPLSDMDKIFHTAHLLRRRRVDMADSLDVKMDEVATLIADTEFKLSINVLSTVLKKIVDSVPESLRERSFNIVMHAKGPDHLQVLVKPMLDEHVDTVPEAVCQDHKYKSNADEASLVQHSAQDPDFVPPDMLAFSVDLRSVINGTPLPRTHYPSLTEGDKWEVDVAMTELKDKQREAAYTRTMQSMVSHTITSNPTTERLPDEAENIKKALAKLPNPSTFQEGLRALALKGSVYDEWDKSREKTVWSSESKVGAS